MGCVKITYVSPNEAELVAMAESLVNKRLVDDEEKKREMAEPAASLWRMRHCIRALLDTGLAFIILTMGSHGAVLCSSTRSLSHLSLLNMFRFPPKEKSSLCTNI